MGTITTKYEVGQKVWVADWQSCKVYEPCPDCLGSKVWHVTTGGGEEFEIMCQTCRAGYGSTGKIESYRRTVTPYQGTIGSIEVHTGGDYDGEHVKYMLEETGVGTGRVWPERKLCLTCAEAERIAQAEIEALEIKDREDRERRAKNQKNDIFYVRRRAQRLRDELEKVIRLLHAEAAPVDQKLFNRMERVLKRNAGFREL